MVMAKGIANGWPVGATITTDEIAHAWKGKTISTFGGNPVCMAALCATQDVLRDEAAPLNAQARGDQLRAGLLGLQARHPWIGDVRGMGLMQGMEIVKDPETKEPDLKRTARLMESTREEGVLVGQGGLWGTVVRIGPSLLITEDEMAEGIERLGQGLRGGGGLAGEGLSSRSPTSGSPVVGRLRARSPKAPRGSVACGASCGAP